MRHHASGTSRDLASWALRPLASVVIAAAFLVFGIAIARAQDPPKDHGLTKVGQNLFRTYCTSCHGAGAEGDGGLAESLHVPPANLTVLAQENQGEFPFDRVLQRIDGRQPVRGHGKTDMPVWGKVFKKVNEDASAEKIDNQVLALAHFIRSLQVTAATE